MITDTKELILALKKVRDERGLNNDQIYEIVCNTKTKHCPSRSSIARVFAEGSEDDSDHFRFDTTLKPLYAALLDIDNDETDDTPEDLAYKSLLRYKKDLIDQYAEQLKEAKDELKVVKDKERERYNKKADEITDNFNKSIAFAKNQIELKDKRIDDLLLEIDKLTVTIHEVVTTNNELVRQMMNCPLKHQEE